MYDDRSTTTADGAVRSFCANANIITYDEFIKIMCFLHQLTLNFRKMDPQGQGNILANFEDILCILLDKSF